MRQVLTVSTPSPLLRIPAPGAISNMAWNQRAAALFERNLRWMNERSILTNLGCAFPVK